MKATKLETRNIFNCVMTVWEWRRVLAPGAPTLRSSGGARLQGVATVAGHTVCLLYHRQSEEITGKTTFTTTSR